MTNKLSPAELLRKHRNKDGRPKLPASQKKSYIITIKLATADYYSLKSKAREMGVTISEFTRNALRNCIVKQRLNSEHLRYILQLIGMANNLNQIAKRANAGGYYNAKSEAELLANKIDNVIKLIEDDG